MRGALSCPGSTRGVYAFATHSRASDGWQQVMAAMAAVAAGLVFRCKDTPASSCVCWQQHQCQAHYAVLQVGQHANSAQTTVPGPGVHSHTRAFNELASRFGLNAAFGHWATSHCRNIATAGRPCAAATATQTSQEHTSASSVVHGRGHPIATLPTRVCNCSGDRVQPVLARCNR